MKKNKTLFITFGTVVGIAAIIAGGGYLITHFPKYNGYIGEYPDLFTVAINSLVGSNGYILSETAFPPVVELLEEDSYGRRLFCYSEDSGTGVSLVVSQKTDGVYVWFYPDYNFISAPLAEGNGIKKIASDVPSEIINPYNDFSLEEIAALKEVNDWEDPLDEGKADMTKIVREKPEREMNEQYLEEIYNAYAEKYSTATSYYGCEYFLSDGYGREMIVLYGDGIIDDVYTMKSIVVVLQADGTCNAENGIMEFTDKYTYQVALKE